MSSSFEPPIHSSLSSDPDMVELVESFVDGLEDHAQRLTEAIEASDAAELARLTHQLKGSGGGYGFDSIGAKAAEVEQLAQACDSIDQAASKAAELISMCLRATAAPVPEG